MMLGAMALVLAGCSTESALPNQDIAPFKNDPTVSASLAGITAGNVTIRVSATNFKNIDPAAATGTHVYGEGHFHLFLDVPPTAPGEVAPHTRNVYHVVDNTYTITGVANGQHHLYVVLGFSDHTPYQAIADSAGKFHGAVAELDFKVGGSDQTAVAAPEATGTPAAAASASPATAAGGGGGSKVQVVADATNGGAYNPTPVRIKVGDTVTWTWEDSSASHTVTADDGKFDSSLLEKGATYSQKFSAAGTIKYHCSVHPAMLGQVIVQ
jgi:plastocyanin